MYRTLRICSNSGAYEALPEPPRPIDLARARRRLEEAGIAVVDARVMLIAALEVEATISRNGRLLFKTRDVSAAERTFERLRELLELDGPGAAVATPPSSDTRPGGGRGD
jgi:hypothetical protein